MLKISYSWIVPGRVVYAVFTVEQTIEEVQCVVDLFTPEFEINGLPPYSHAIFDTTNLKVLYSGFQAMKVFKPLAQHPQTGWFVQINSNLSITTNIVTNMIFQTAKARFRNVKTLPDAIRFLNDVDSSLPDLASMDFTLPPARDILDWPIPQRGTATTPQQVDVKGEK